LLTGSVPSALLVERGDGRRHTTQADPDIGLLVADADLVARGHCPQNRIAGEKIERREIPDQPGEFGCCHIAVFTAADLQGERNLFTLLPLLHRGIHDLHTRGLPRPTALDGHADVFVTIRAISYRNLIAAAAD
jgi:hypothetical protein